MVESCIVHVKFNLFNDPLCKDQQLFTLLETLEFHLNLMANYRHAFTYEVHSTPNDLIKSLFLKPCSNLNQN